MRGGWRQWSYQGGQFALIKDLVATGAHRIEAWGNSKEGWWPYLVKDNAGVQIGPYFGPDDGSRLKDLKAAAGRAYGIDPKDVKLGRNWA
ncbi:hypothetical protein [Mesorhizobium sp. B2-8-3]|uniref:hypothetical protein n=1 Tax=Mesorhizobium sp. B2-8-3 TaxID=2589905 RepID=UPI001128C5E7|nr:hypothetical protein [Mesorhizobium sp. B2-8-3]TPJ33691.1 hypothetical protein FJ418_13765 [Mesorhizobium sp. B2-8-3]